MTFDRGDVVWSDDPFREEADAGRPWLVVGNETQPFRDEQSMTIALSTSGYESALPIVPGDWRDGGLPRPSYGLPWAIHSLRYDDVDRRVGRLTDSLVDDIVDDLASYVERLK